MKELLNYVLVSLKGNESNKKIKTFLPSLSILLLLLCLFLSFTNVYASTVRATSVKLNKTKIVLGIGRTDNLKYYIYPNTTRDKRITWISSNTKVAKIDSKGKISSVGVGKATIAIVTADGHRTAYCSITVSSQWTYKKFVTFGDSITWYDGKIYNFSNKESSKVARGYQTYMREKLKCTVYNQGANGDDMTQIYSIIKNYNYRNINAVTITSGANDHRKGISTGTVLRKGSKFNTKTYAGALQASIEKIKASNRTAKIYLLAPIKGYFNENHTSSVPNLYRGQKTVSIDYVNVMKSVGRLYGISVCDLYNSTWINSLPKNVLMGDKTLNPYYLHPSNQGYSRIADVLIPFLK